MLIDTHCHINCLPSPTRQKILSQAGNSYVFIDISIDEKTALSSLGLSREYPFIYTAMGYHPLGEINFSPEVIPKYNNYINKEKKVIAIGEVGLDYKSLLSPSQQMDILSEFIKLAQAHNLTLIIHNRWYDNSIFSILDSFFFDYQKVVFHCFSQDRDFLEKIIAKHGFVSFSLNILRDKKEIKEALSSIPLFQLLVETDSPYMKIKGNYSTPLDIDKVYQYIAMHRGIDINELIRIVEDNVTRAFNIEINERDSSHS